MRLVRNQELKSMNRRIVSAAKQPKAFAVTSGQMQTRASAQTFNPFVGFITTAVMIHCASPMITSHLFHFYLSLFIPPHVAFHDFPRFNFASQCNGTSVLFARPYRGKSFVNFARLIFSAAKRAQRCVQYVHHFRNGIDFESTTLFNRKRENCCRKELLQPFFWLKSLRIRFYGLCLFDD